MIFIGKIGASILESDKETLIEKLGFKAGDDRHFYIIAEVTDGSSAFRMYKNVFKKLHFSDESSTPRFDKYSLVTHNELKTLVSMAIDCSSMNYVPYTMHIMDDSVRARCSSEIEAFDTVLSVNSPSPTSYTTATMKMSSIAEQRGMPGRIVLNCKNIVRQTHIIKHIRVMMDRYRDQLDGFYVENNSPSIADIFKRYEDANWEFGL